MTKPKDPKDFKKLGRPTKYSEELGDLICKVIARSFRGLKYHCKRRDDFPSYVTVMKWMFNNKHPEFVNRYTRAKMEQADNMADQIIEVPFKMRAISKFESEKAKLKVDALKWCAAKLKPKKYSDRLLQEVTGKDGGAVKMETDKMDLSKLSQEELFLFKQLAEKITPKQPE